MLGFGDSAKPRGHDYRLLEQADLQQALLAHLGVSGPVHVLAHDYGDSVAQELLARHHEGRFELASCVFLNGGLFPETHHAVRVQKLLLGPLGPLIGRLFSRRKLAANFARIFGPDTQPSEAELDDFYDLIKTGNGPAVMHRLIRYIPERRVQRDRWVAAGGRLPALTRVSGANLVPLGFEIGLGTSGGPVFDDAGRVAGVALAILAERRSASAGYDEYKDTGIGLMLPAAAFCGALQSR